MSTLSITLSSSSLARTGQCLGLPALDKAGEVIAAAEALTRTLAGAGTDLYELATVFEHGGKEHASAPPTTHDTVALARRSFALNHRLAMHEAVFIVDMTSCPHPTERQKEWLSAIAQQLGAGVRR